MRHIVILVAALVLVPVAYSAGKPVSPSAHIHREHSQAPKKIWVGVLTKLEKCLRSQLPVEETFRDTHAGTLFVRYEGGLWSYTVLQLTSNSIRAVTDTYLYEPQEVLLRNCLNLALR